MDATILVVVAVLFIVLTIGVWAAGEGEAHLYENGDE